MLVPAAALRRSSKACLEHIRDHTAEVVKLPAYDELIRAWPEIALKINFFMMGLYLPSRLKTFLLSTGAASARRLGSFKALAGRSSSRGL